MLINAICLSLLDALAVLFYIVVLIFLMCSLAFCVCLTHVWQTLADTYRYLIGR